MMHTIKCLHWKPDLTTLEGKQKKRHHICIFEAQTVGLLELRNTIPDLRCFKIDDVCKWPSLSTAFILKLYLWEVLIHIL